MLPLGATTGEADQFVSAEVQPDDLQAPHRTSFPRKREPKAKAVLLLLGSHFARE